MDGYGKEKGKITPSPGSRFRTGEKNIPYRGGGMIGLYNIPLYTAFSSLMKQHKLGKKWSENASERVHFSKFSYPGEGHIPSPGPYTCAISALRASLRWTQQHSKSRPPLLKSSDCPWLSRPRRTLYLPWRATWGSASGRHVKSVYNWAPLRREASHYSNDVKHGIYIKK